VSPNGLALDALNTSQPAARLVPALIVTPIFGLIGYLTREVTISGAVAGTIVAFAIWMGLGVGGFVTLFAVFGITWLTTRIGYSHKRELGLAENKRGRNAAQVMANVGAAAVFAVLAIRFGPLFGMAAIACLAEATADTASSEIGEALSKRAWLVTTFRQVPPGENGGVSLPGTLAGIAAAAGIAVAARSLHLTHSIAIPLIAAILGTLFDSWLGATVERMGLIGNNTVNAICTAAAGLIVIAFAG
jgi:uncharacterized protein (TIGR00297 family)